MMSVGISSIVDTHRQRIAAVSTYVEKLLAVMIEFLLVVHQRFVMSCNV